jgi:hypothetical protein
LPSFPFPYPIRFFDVNEKIKKTQAAMWLMCLNATVDNDWFPLPSYKYEMQ